MIYVKLCGMTSARDARLAVGLGAQAIGLVFHAPSPRNVTPEMAREIAAAVAGAVHCVGVFVNEVPARVRELVRFCGLSHAQLHGTEPVEDARGLGVPVIKAFRVKRREDLAAIEPWRGVVEAVLLDAQVEGKAGGTGETFDWSLAAEAACRSRILLAGGLTPANVGQALARVRPFGVDVSSSLESAPGVKDPERMKAFVAAVRAAEAGLQRSGEIDETR